MKKYQVLVELVLASLWESIVRVFPYSDWTEPQSSSRTAPFEIIDIRLKALCNKASNFAFCVPLIVGIRDFLSTRSGVLLQTPRISCIVEQIELACPKHPTPNGNVIGAVASRSINPSPATRTWYIWKMLQKSDVESRRLKGCEAPFNDSNQWFICKLEEVGCNKVRPVRHDHCWDVLGPTGSCYHTVHPRGTVSSRCSFQNMLIRYHQAHRYYIGCFVGKACLSSCTSNETPVTPG